MENQKHTTTAIELLSASEAARILREIDPELAGMIRESAPEVDPGMCPACLFEVEGDTRPGDACLCYACSDHVRELVRASSLISPPNRVREAILTHVDRALVAFYSDEGDEGRGA